MEAIFENATKSSITSIDHEKKYFLMYSEGHVSTEDFKGGFNAILEQIQHHKYNRIIINIKNVKSTPILARTWLVSTYLPELYKNIEGNLQIGLINTTSFFEGTAISLMVGSIQALGFNLGIKFYKSVEEAEKAILPQV